MTESLNRKEDGIAEPRHLTTRRLTVWPVSLYI